MDSISERHGARLLAEAELKPHQSRYWLHFPDPAGKAKVEDLCEVYQQASARAEPGELTYHLDEMTGIQAIARTKPDIPPKPGRSTGVEFDCIRHGPQTLTASFNVATGQIDPASVGDK